jgi:hypothetical protein
MGLENTKKDIYAESREITRIDECDFYHTMDIPGLGVVNGKWDLRDGVDQYLGSVNFKGKRVLELGTASGFLCFHMEKQGAEVVAHDIGEGQPWDMVPFCQYDYKEHIESFKEYNRRLKNAYWYAHRAYNSKAKVIYSSVYDIPEEIGIVDIGTFCAILLHLRDPFLALQSATRLVRDTVIVTDLAPRRTLISPIYPRHHLGRLSSFVKRYASGQRNALAEHKLPYMQFLPDFRTLAHKDAWWSLSPEIIINFIGVLGFEETRVTYHTHKLYGKEGRLFTVVGKRTRDI